MCIMLIELKTVKFSAKCSRQLIKGKYIDDVISGRVPEMNYDHPVNGVSTGY